MSQGREVDRIISSLEEAVSNQIRNIRKIQEEQNDAIMKLQCEIDSCRDTRAKLEQSIENKKNTIRTNREELHKVKNDIFEVIK